MICVIDNRSLCSRERPADKLYKNKIGGGWSIYGFECAWLTFRCIAGLSRSLKRNHDHGCRYISLFLLGGRGGGGRRDPS